MTIAESFKRFRHSIGLSQKQVAGRLNISQQAYSVYETGTIPTATVLMKIADEFDVSTDYLLGRTDEPRPLYKAAEEKPAADSELTLEKLQKQFEELKAALRAQGLKV